jgi:DNA repair photolyase
VKEDAPELLAAELAKPKWKPQVLAMSGVTDPYQPIERRLQITRRCLEVLARFRNPVAIITKNALVTRDIDFLGELAAHDAAAVNVSVTSLDPKLQRILEPRTSAPRARLEAIAQLHAAGIPVGVMVAPIIPGLTDHEVPAILQACAEAGARWAGYVVVRLPFAVAPLFERWLEEHFPERKEKVLGRIRHLRGGERLNDPRFKSRMCGEGIFAEQIRALFDIGCKRAGFSGRVKLSTASFRRPNEQLSLF